MWDTATGEKLQELRRGTDRADICCIVFNASSTLLACASDKGTVHIFKLGGVDSAEEVAASGGAQSAGTSAGVGAGGGLSSSNAASGSGAVGGGGVAPIAGGASGAGSSVGGGGGGGGASTASGAPGGDPDGAAATGSSFLKRMLPKYFTSEWSFAQFRVPAMPSVCAFGTEPYTIMVVCADGSFFKANFEKGGEAVRIACECHDILSKRRARKRGQVAHHLTPLPPPSAPPSMKTLILRIQRREKNSGAGQFGRVSARELAPTLPLPTLRATRCGRFDPLRRRRFPRSCLLHQLQKRAVPLGS